MKQVFTGQISPNQQSQRCFLIQPLTYNEMDFAIPMLAFWWWVCNDTCNYSLPFSVINNIQHIHEKKCYRYLELHYTKMICSSKNNSAFLLTKNSRLRYLKKVLRNQIESYLWVLLIMKKPNSFNVWIRIVSFPDANNLNTVLTIQTTNAQCERSNMHH